MRLGVIRTQIQIAWNGYPALHHQINLDNFSKEDTVPNPAYTNLVESDQKCWCIHSVLHQKCHSDDNHVRYLLYGRCSCILQYFQAYLVWTVLRCLHSSCHLQHLVLGTYLVYPVADGLCKQVPQTSASKNCMIKEAQHSGNLCMFHKVRATRNQKCRRFLCNICVRRRLEIAQY